MSVDSFFVGSMISMLGSAMVNWLIKVVVNRDYLILSMRSGFWSLHIYIEHNTECCIYNSMYPGFYA